MFYYQAPIPPVATRPQTSPQDRVRHAAPTARVCIPRRKSVLTALLLAGFLGPIGLAYASVRGAAVSAFLVLLLGVPVAMFYPPWMYVALVLVSPMCIAWALTASVAHNLRRRTWMAAYAQAGTPCRMQ
ncbi:hypothetical protein [Gephyromycinifex aptenodytis]|uniref:hypothetical protein n=1 Tax=Gephyromycinifex aptenodytis TaxID=2716227 RepID=UPI001445CD9D|nr:hypothetical protein [Gephyromycinifex aptenodytis]